MGIILRGINHGLQVMQIMQPDMMPGYGKRRGKPVFLKS